MSGEKSVPQEQEAPERQEGVDLEPQTAEEENAGEEAQETGAEEGEKSLEETLREARTQAEESYDRYLRAVAELDNYRKRTARIRTETREEALRDVLLQIAPILDNMSRALAQESKKAESLRQGVELIYGQFKDALQRYGLEEIEAIGEAFDPNLHEALVEIESQDHPPGSVVEEMEKGYTLNKKVVRPSRVVVNKAEA